MDVTPTPSHLNNLLIAAETNDLPVPADADADSTNCPNPAETNDHRSDLVDCVLAYLVSILRSARSMTDL